MLLVLIILATSRRHIAYLVLSGRPQLSLSFIRSIARLILEPYFILILAGRFLYFLCRKMLISLAYSMTTLILALLVLSALKVMPLIFTSVLRHQLNKLQSLLSLLFVLMVHLNFVKVAWGLIYEIEAFLSRSQLPMPISKMAKLNAILELWKMVCSLCLLMLNSL